MATRSYALSCVLNGTFRVLSCVSQLEEIAHCDVAILATGNQVGALVFELICPF